MSIRDEISVEIQTVNGKPFNGSLTFNEAKEGIIVNCLELNPKLLHGLRFCLSRCPVIKYKLKEQIDSNELKCIEDFKFYRHYKARGEDQMDTFGFKINGIRSGDYGDLVESDPDRSLIWVKIE